MRQSKTIREEGEEGRRVRRWEEKGVKEVFNYGPNIQDTPSDYKMKNK